MVNKAKPGSSIVVQTICKKFLNLPFTNGQRRMAHVDWLSVQEARPSPDIWPPGVGNPVSHSGSWYGWQNRTGDMRSVPNHSYKVVQVATNSRPASGGIRGQACHSAYISRPGVGDPVSHSGYYFFWSFHRFPRLYFLSNFFCFRAAKFLVGLIFKFDNFIQSCFVFISILPCHRFLSHWATDFSALNPFFLFRRAYASLVRLKSFQ